jgi:hypothetical protein
VAPSPNRALPPADSSSGGCTSIHFGENQLSPRSVGISPLSTTHPPVLQHGWVRASTTCHSRFTLVMDSSRGFGSHRRHTVAHLRTRFPSGSPALPLVDLLRRCTRRIMLQKARHQSWGGSLTADKDGVSGTLSFPSRGAFHLSLTVLVHYRSLEVLSLGGWSPLLPTRLHVSRGTQDPDPAPAPSRYGTLTRSGQPFQAVRVWTAAAVWSVLQPHGGQSRPGLGSAQFARHYCGHLG